MGGSYRQCSECGKRALSIATRCPGCGRELPALAGPEPRRNLELGRYLSPAVAGLIAVAVILAAVELGGADDSGGRHARLAAESATDSSEVAFALGATARLDTASVEATTETRTEILVARTWTNVRKARSRRADLEAVLTPGDSVLADSLDRDWYRVTFQDEVLGYAHRSTLALPPVTSLTATRSGEAYAASDTGRTSREERWGGVASPPGSATEPRYRR